jgi:hypothetical protein
MISYGSHHKYTSMPQNRRSHQLGEGQAIGAEMLSEIRPSHQLGEGHQCGAEMPTWTHPSQPVFGSRNHNAAMPMEKRSHLFTRGQTPVAEMLFENRLSREGPFEKHRNVRGSAPFPTSLWETSVRRRNAIAETAPTSFGPPLSRRKAAMPSPNFNQRPIYLCSNAMYLTPRNQGDPIWIQDMKTRLSLK